MVENKGVLRCFSVCFLQILGYLRFIDVENKGVFLVIRFTEAWDILVGWNGVKCYENGVMWVVFHVF